MHTSYSIILITVAIAGTCAGVEEPPPHENRWSSIHKKPEAAPTQKAEQVNDELPLEKYPEKSPIRQVMNAVIKIKTERLRETLQRNRQLSSTELGRALRSALYQKQLEMVDLLLEHGADPNAPDIDDLNTPLHTATRMGNVACVRHMLRKGADPDRMNLYGTTPREYAIRYGSMKMQEVFESPTAGLSALRSTCQESLIPSPPCRSDIPLKDKLRLPLPSPSPSPSRQFEPYSEPSAHPNSNNPFEFLQLSPRDWWEEPTEEVEESENDFEEEESSYVSEDDASPFSSPKRRSPSRSNSPSKKNKADCAMQ